MFSPDFDFFKATQLSSVAAMLTSTMTPTATAIPDEKGLLNHAGENNCFLNVVIQSLWHLDAFRTKFTSHQKEHKHSETCVFCALEVIFTQYEFSTESCLPPTVLREAMAILFKPQQRFQLFEIDDASEALLAVLDRLHGQFQDVVDSQEVDKCRDPDCVPHRVFGINLTQQIRCPDCGGASDPSQFVLFSAYNYATALRNAKERSAHEFPQPTFDKILYAASEDKRMCPNKPKCTRMCNISHYLTELPEVFTVSIVWTTPNPDTEEIASILGMIDLRINIMNVFPNLKTAPDSNGVTSSVMHDNWAKCNYRLRGMICYYGLHYVAFFYNRKRSEWIVFDDSTVKPVGVTWSVVQQKCIKGRLQPAVVFYESEQSESDRFLFKQQQQEFIQQLQLDSFNKIDTDSDFDARSISSAATMMTQSSLTSSFLTGSSGRDSVIQSSMQQTESIKISKVKLLQELESPPSSLPQHEITETAPLALLPQYGSLEKSFFFVSNDNSEKEEVDFVVTRTNWMYRRQTRRYRFKQDCFVRILPGTTNVKDRFDYVDVFNVTLTSETSMIISFYSGKESQYITSDRAQEILQLLQHRSTLLGHTFKVDKAF